MSPQIAGVFQDYLLGFLEIVRQVWCGGGPYLARVRLFVVRGTQTTGQKKMPAIDPVLSANPVSTNGIKSSA
jgi:hypothetical protein